MHTRTARKFCPRCKKDVKAERNASALGPLGYNLGDAVTHRKAWHCTECGSRITRKSQKERR